MKRVLVVMAVLLVAGASQAGLNDPAVGNASFEDIVLAPDVGDWGFDAGAPWGETGGSYLENNLQTSSDPTPYGNNSMRIAGGAAVYQEIGTWSPDTNYEVTLWLGERYDGAGAPLSSWVVGELWGGGASGYGGADVSLWDNTGATWVDYAWSSAFDTGSTSGDVTVTLNTSAWNAGGLVEGDALWIRLAADGPADLNIDNIRVTPEPMTLALLGFGGLGLLRRRK